MVVLGLLLLLASGVFTVGVLMQSTDAATVSAFGQSASGLTVGGLFLAGAITGAIAILGITMMLAGASRRRSRRVARRREVLDARDEKESLAEENERLQRQLAESRRSDVAAYPDDDVVGRHSETETSDRGGFFHR